MGPVGFCWVLLGSSHALRKTRRHLPIGRSEIKKQIGCQNKGLRVLVPPPPPPSHIHTRTHTHTHHHHHHHPRCVPHLDEPTTSQIDCEIKKTIHAPPPLSFVLLCRARALRGSAAPAPAWACRDKARRVRPRSAWPWALTARRGRPRVRHQAWWLAGWRCCGGGCAKGRAIPRPRRGRGIHVSPR